MHTFNESNIASAVDPAINAFNIRIDKFNGPAVSGPVVQAEEFMVLEYAQKLIDDARAQSDALLSDARAQAAQIRAASAQLGEDERAALIHETRDATVAQGLHWLVDEARLESALVDSVETRVRELIADTLREWLDEQDRIAQIARQLTMLVCERARQRPYRIRLHPDECESISAQLSLDSIECVADSTLKAGQAVVDTEFLRIEFDLDRHQAQVLKALRAACGGTNLNMQGDDDEPA